MPQAHRWYLPDGINEVLPPQSAQLEQLRRTILDLFQSWGYELVVPPLVEYLDSLLTGTGRELDRETFKVTDQLTGRMMGIRADMTPQVARIDAHRLQRDAPNRLCYLGPVLHTLPSSFAGSRNPFQVGAEIYGHDGIASDVEVLCLLLECLRHSGTADDVVVDLGHMAILRSLAAGAQLTAGQTNVLFDLLQRKAHSDLQVFCHDAGMAETVTSACLKLIDLNGGAAILDTAAEALASLKCPEINQALEDLRSLAEAVAARAHRVTFHYDLAEVGGYRYYTGVAFAAYSVGCRQALAKGGRYNDIGKVFGRARPATGFSTDIKRLVELTAPVAAGPAGILAPWSQDPALQGAIAALRRDGQRVVNELPGQQFDLDELGCDRRLELREGRWTVSEG